MAGPCSGRATFVLQSTGMETTIHDLKLRLSEYLALVEGGETVVVTKRGKPIARIQPAVASSFPPDLRRLIESGRANYQPAPFQFPTPAPLLPGEKTGVDYVRDQRR